MSQCRVWYHRITGGKIEHCVKDVEARDLNDAVEKIKIEVSKISGVDKVRILD